MRVEAPGFLTRAQKLKPARTEVNRVPLNMSLSSSLSLKYCSVSPVRQVAALFCHASPLRWRAASLRPGRDRPERISLCNTL